MDCIEGLKQIPDKSVNMYFVDLPYGVTTKNKWDNIIPPEPMWEQNRKDTERQWCNLILRAR